MKFGTATDSSRSSPERGSNRNRRDIGFLASVWWMAAVLVLFSPAMLIALGWFTEGYSDTPNALDVSHRVHEVVFGVLFTVALIGALSQLRDSARNTAGFAQLAVTLVALTVYVTMGIGWDWGLLIYGAPLLSMAALRRHTGTWDFGRPWWGALGLGFLMLVPLLSEINRHVDRAALGAADHTTHWSAVAAFETLLLGLVVIVFLRLPGYRMSAASLAGASFFYGLASLVFPFDASSHRMAFSIALLLWAAGWVVLLVSEGRPRSPRLAIVHRFIQRHTSVVGVAMVLLLSAAVHSIIVFALAALASAAVLVWLKRTGRTQTESSGVMIRRAATVLTLMIVALVIGELDNPPNVPHRPDPSQPAFLAADVNVATCQGCHAVLKNGAPIPFHGMNERCTYEMCWGGRTDCAGCHQIDPQLGGSTLRTAADDLSPAWVNMPVAPGPLSQATLAQAQALAAGP